jgi:hypothetical protein
MLCNPPRKRVCDIFHRLRDPPELAGNPADDPSGVTILVVIPLYFGRIWIAWRFRPPYAKANYYTHASMGSA